MLAVSAVLHRAALTQLHHDAADDTAAATAATGDPVLRSSISRDNGGTIGGPGDDGRRSSSFIPVPVPSRKLFWVEEDPRNKLYAPVVRAFHSRGWSRTEDRTRAHVLWTDQPPGSGEQDDDGYEKSDNSNDSDDDFHSSLLPWQRYNHFRHTKEWDDKDRMAAHMDEYYRRRGVSPLFSFPESYVLHHREGRDRFLQRLLHGGGMDVPWVLKRPTFNRGQGVLMLGPRSDGLRQLLRKLQDVTERDNETETGQGGGNGGRSRGSKKGRKGREERFVVQRYICDEMTYRLDSDPPGSGEGRKFDIRVFWMVASADPLVVLYHTQNNYVRIGQGRYDEGNFTDTRAHLTTHTFGAGETKATWDQFRRYVETHARHTLLLGEERRRGAVVDGMRQRLPALIKTDPFQHVQNQAKTIIAHLADAFANITFHTRHNNHGGERDHDNNAPPPQNAFSLHAADLIIDNNLDVYLIEGTDGPGKDEDYDFRVEMHNAVFGSMVDIVQHVSYLQENGLPLDVDSMRQAGILGGYDVVYNDGWMFDYRYDRLEQRGCGAGAAGGDAHVVAFPTTTPNNATSPAASKSESAISTSPPEAPSLVFPSAGRPLKTFFMKGRTTRRGGAITRSLRRNGWVPVDKIEDAQLVYGRAEGEIDHHSLQPWQIHNQFPSEFSFFRERSWDADRTKPNGRICNPIQYKGREFGVMVYWLVLSVDPLIVLYHDGYLDIPYSAEDENEFWGIPAGVQYDVNGTGPNRPVWRGSWACFEHLIRATHRRTSLRDQIRDPIQHVKGQIRRTLTKVGRDFDRHHSNNHVGKQGSNNDARFFALYSAEFEVDRNLNTLLADLTNLQLRGEEFQEAVDLHDDLYGTAFQLIERLIVNSTQHAQGGNPTTLLSATLSEPSLMGGYEILIYDTIAGVNMDDHIISLEKVGSGKASECDK